MLKKPLQECTEKGVPRVWKSWKARADLTRTLEPSVAIHFKITPAEMQGHRMVYAGTSHEGGPLWRG